MEESPCFSKVDLETVAIWAARRHQVSNPQRLMAFRASRCLTISCHLRNWQQADHLLRTLRTLHPVLTQ